MGHLCTNPYASGPYPLKDDQVFKDDQRSIKLNFLERELDQIKSSFQRTIKGRSNSTCLSESWIKSNQVFKGRSKVDQTQAFLSESWIKSNQVFKGRSKVDHAPLFF